MRVYVCGPMTGYINYNYPAFMLAQQRLEALGFEVVNPATLHDEEVPGSKPHHEYLRTDIRALLECTHIYKLPGWKRSTGASCEDHVARVCQITALPANTIEWRDLVGEREPDPVDAAIDRYVESNV